MNPPNGIGKDHKSLKFGKITHLAKTVDRSTLTKQTITKYKLNKLKLAKALKLKESG